MTVGFGEGFLRGGGFIPRMEEERGILPVKLLEGAPKAGREVRKLKELLSSGRLGDPCILGVVLFGSVARGEAGPYSDVDLLVLYEEKCAPTNALERRRRFYQALSSTLGRAYPALTVLDMPLTRFLHPERITGLLLNIYWEGIALYDPTGEVESLLSRAKRGIARSGLRRLRDGRDYYWVLPKPLREVPIL